MSGADAPDDVLELAPERRMPGEDDAPRPGFWS
jgi:hypothetical protein